MQIILLERLGKYGKVGDIVTVKDGYARNFLIPQQKALRATKENKAFFEQQKASIENENLQKLDQAKQLASKMVDEMINVISQAGEDGRLFGSVKSKDIVDGLAVKGFKIERSQVNAQSIKSLGIHGVKIQLHPEVLVNIYVNVARSEAEVEEAATQFKNAQAKADKQSNQEEAA